MNRWNGADSLLLGAGVLFFVALGIKNSYPCVLSEGFLFVAEAALVGGIADWFAVTALFKKPLGFPFHTAILPNRREEFINASVKMVRKEFFSQRTIFRKVSDLRLLPVVTEKFETPDTRREVLKEIFGAVKKYVGKQDKELFAKKIAGEMRRALQEIDARTLISFVGGKLKTGDKDKKIFAALVGKIRDTAATSETREKIQRILEDFAEEKKSSAGIFSVLMAGLAEALDFVNLAEAAEIVQKQLLKFLDELLTDSPLQRRALTECRLQISQLSETPEFRNLAEHLQVEIAGEFPLEKATELMLIHLENQIVTVDPEEDLPKVRKENFDDGKSLGFVLLKFFDDGYSKFLDLLKNPGEVNAAAEKFLREIAMRTAIYAQPLAGEIARDALGKLTPEQLNSLVYDKAEEDFVWIRKNGSIVGAIVGAALFCLIKLATAA